MLRLLCGAMLVLLAMPTADGQPPTNAAEPSAEDGAASPSQPIEIYADVMPACPRRGCWAVTCEALQRLEGVERVDIEPTYGSLMRLRLKENKLPDQAAWKKTFQAYVGTASEFRGIVAKIDGQIEGSGDRLVLKSEIAGPLVLLLGKQRLRWDAEDGADKLTVQVTGDLVMDAGKQAIRVRELNVSMPPAPLPYPGGDE